MGLSMGIWLAHFGDPTPNPSSVNSALGLSLLPLDVPDVLCRIQNTTD